MWIIRRDVAAQAVSFFIALNNGAWEEWASSSPASGAPAERPPIPPYDFAFIDRCRRHIEWEDACWTRFFLANGIRPFVVVYEDFEQDYAATLRSVAEFAGVDMSRADTPAPALRKQRSGVSREYAKAYIAERRERGIDEPALLLVDPLMVTTAG